MKTLATIAAVTVLFVASQAGASVTAAVFPFLTTTPPSGTAVVLSDDNDNFDIASPLTPASVTQDADDNVAGFSSVADAVNLAALNASIDDFASGMQFVFIVFNDVSFDPTLSGAPAGTTYDVWLLDGFVWADGDTNFFFPESNNADGSNVVVPEPASIALLGLGGAALLARRRRA